MEKMCSSEKKRRPALTPMDGQWPLRPGGPYPGGSYPPISLGPPSHYPAYGTQSFPYPECPQSSTQYSAEEVHETAEGGECPVETNTDQGGSQPAVRGKQRKGGGREKNYSNREDEALCSAYLNVTKDPIVGANQPGTAYWKRIHQFYHEHKDFPGPDRKHESLSQRWGLISRATSVFTSMKAREDRLNQSRKTDEDRVKDALRKWTAAHDGDEFKYLHCWRLLRGEPKWLNKVSGKGDGGTNGQAPTGPSASGQPSESNLPEDSGRPIGRDSAKKKRSADQAAAASNSACLEVLQDMSVTRKSGREERASRYEHIFEADSKKIALKERMVQVQEEALVHQRQVFQFQIQQAEEAREDRDDRVMCMDLSNMTAEQRAYWKGRQADILNRRKWTVHLQ